MSFKFFIYLFILSIFLGCGVKAKPLKPPESAIKSYIESYTGPIPEEEKSKKSEKTKK